jgi:hypothetical protein
MCDARLPVHGIVPWERKDGENCHIECTSPARARRDRGQQAVTRAIRLRPNRSRAGEPLRCRVEADGLFRATIRGLTDGPADCASAHKQSRWRAMGLRARMLFRRLTSASAPSAQIACRPHRCMALFW